MDQSERTLLADKDVPGDWPGPAVPQLTHVANQPITKTSENTAHLSRPSALTCGNDWAAAPCTRRPGNVTGRGRGRTGTTIHDSYLKTKKEEEEEKEGEEKFLPSSSSPSIREPWRELPGKAPHEGSRPRLLPSPSPLPPLGAGRRNPFDI